MVGRILVAGVVFSIAGAIAATTACLAGDPAGAWLTEKGDARVRVVRCSGALCGTVVWLKVPIDPATGRPPVDDNNPDPKKKSQPVLGLRIIYHMKPSRTPGIWKGRLYNPEDGNTYEGQMILVIPTKLRVEGCVLAICSGETWTRVK